MKKEKLICPRCHSTNNIPFWGNAAAVDFGTFASFRKCETCGYVGKYFTTPDDGKSYEIDYDAIEKAKRKKEKLKPLAIIILILILLFILFLKFL